MLKTRMNKRKTRISAGFSLAEMEGFEPSRHFRTLLPSRGAPSPLGYISKGYELLSEVLAERMGFEPMALMSHRFSRPAP